jgi:non-ribosomal peptide synthase protein (TIGR01720 family)
VNSDADRLRARMHWQKLARQSRDTDLRVALLASFTVDPLVPYLGNALTGDGFTPELWVGPFNQIERQCLDDASETAKFAPQVLVVAPRLEELWSGKPLPLDVPHQEYEAGLRYVADACVKAAERWNAELLFVLPGIPGIRPAGVGDDGNSAGVMATAAVVRESIRRHLASHSVVDSEVLLRGIGDDAYRPSLMATAQIPFSEEYFDLLARRISRLIGLRRRPHSPLVVLDHGLGTTLDDFLAEVSRLGALVERGDAAQISELSAGADRVVFLSKDASAIAQVATRTPEVATVLLPADPEFWPRVLNDSGLVDQIPPSRAKPAVSASPALTLESFLQSLNLSVECTALTPETHEAAADLTVRVSEFHMDGGEWPVRKFAEQPGTWWGIHVRDRFGDHGMCGVVGGRADGTTFVVDVWVLTCPVLGKGVEEEVLNHLGDRARELGCDSMTFGYRPTPRNDAFHRFLSGLRPFPIGEAAEIVIPATGTSTGHRAPETAVPRQVRSRPVIRPNGKVRLSNATQILDAVAARGPKPVRNSDVAVIQPRTDTERLLTEVFASVLRVPEIGIEHNFFSSGGDSMLAVRMIAKANQAGLRMTLRQVFKHQTPAALATVATAVQRYESSAVEVGPAPILPSQGWFFGLDLANPDHFNQSQRFEVADADPAAMRRAVAELLRRHQALRVRFGRTAAGWQQTDSGPPGTTPFTHVDLAGQDDWDAAITAAETRMQSSMRPADGRLFQVALFTFGTGRLPLLLIVTHHLAIDGVSWRIVVEDLENSYRRELGAVGLPAPAGIPVLAWAKRLSEYAQSEEIRAELSKWLVRDEIAPLPVDVDAPRGAFTHTLEVQLSADETKALRERAVTVDRVSLDVLMLTAVTTALAQWTKQRRFLVDVVNHGREPFIDGVDVSGTVGWLNANVPVLFEIEDDLVPAIERRLREHSSHHGLGDNLLRYLGEQSVQDQIGAMPKAEILFAYIGHVGADEQSLFKRAPCGGELDMDPGADTRYSLQFNTLIIGDRVVLEIYYHGTRYHESTVQSLLADCATVLKGLALNNLPRKNLIGKN